MAITDYTVVSAPTPASLSAAVEATFIDGWQPTGNVFFSGNSLMQALVKASPAPTTYIGYRACASTSPAGLTEQVAHRLTNWPNTDMLGPPVYTPSGLYIQTTASNQNAVNER